MFESPKNIGFGALKRGKSFLINVLTQWILTALMCNLILFTIEEPLQ